METYSPKQYLLIDAASQYGFDKLVYADRLKFGREVLEAVIDNNTDNVEEFGMLMDSWIEEADEPEMFSAALLAIKDAVDGKPSGYTVGHDAASSGPQILSCLTRCDTGMMNTGSIDTGEVPDLYTLIKDNMGFEASRTEVKKATVPFVYGSRLAPENVFGPRYQEFINAYGLVVPGAAWAKDALIGCWNTKAMFHEWTAPDGGVAHIKVIAENDAKGMFQGRQYTYQYKENAPVAKGKGTRSIGANATHTYDGYILRELHRRCNYNPAQVKWQIKVIEAHLAGKLVVADERDLEKKRNLLRLQKLALRHNNFSIRAIEFIDTYTLRGCKPQYLEKLLETLKSCLTYHPFKVRTIHDEFACLANHVVNMKQVYNDLLAEAYNSTWLYDVIQDLSGISHHHLQPKHDAATEAMIRDNSYSLN